MRMLTKIKLNLGLLCQKAFKNSTDKASEVSTGGILN